MRPLHKRGIRVLGIAESHSPGQGSSALAGVVMRRDMIADGFVFGRAAVRGRDATRAILEMYRGSGRSDIECVLLWGVIIASYNVVDISYISKSLRLPVLGLSGRRKRDLGQKSKSPGEAALYHALPPVHPIPLATGYTVYARVSGCTRDEARRLLSSLTLQGGIPEPVRLARLLAASVRRYYPSDADFPPSTLRTVPVTQDDSSEA